MKAALVLSGGGALGAAHLGAVEVLHQAGLQFDFFSGVSAGAIVAAALAAGRSTDEIWKELSRSRLFPLAFDLSGNPLAFLRGARIQRALERFLRGATFEDLQSPLSVHATDFATGELVTINSGSIAEGVRASLSVPGIFSPYYSNSMCRWLVDGGLVNNLPLEHALQNYTGELIVAIDVATFLKPPEIFIQKRRLFFKTRGVVTAISQAVKIMLLDQQRRFLEGKAEPRLAILKPNLVEFAAIDIFKLAKIREAGRTSAIGWLETEERFKELRQRL